MISALPWVYTAIAVFLSAVGHVLYKYYVMTEKLLFLILTVVIFISIPLFSFLALRDLTIAQVYLCTATVPLMTTLGAKIFIKEIISKHHFIGLVLITSGTITYILNS